MKIYRIFTYSQNLYAYIQHTGLNFETIDRIVDGKKIACVDLTNLVLKNVTKDYCDFMGTGMTEFFISNRFKRIIANKVNREINFIETNINENQYWLINILGLRDCMDYKKSTYSKFKNGTPNKITNLVVNNNEIDKYDLFRLKDSPVNIFITEALKEELEKNNLTGFRIIETMDLTVG